MNPKIYLAGARAKLNALFARGLIAYVSALLLIVLTVGLAVFLFINSAVPNTITIVSGPDGSMFGTISEKYKKILARQGIKLRVIPSDGSRDNLKKLADPKIKVDVGFVQGGEANDFDAAVLAFKKDLKKNPGDPLTFLGLGNVYLKQKK